MHYTTLISVEALQEVLPTALIFDCRHQLADESWGASAYAKAHIPNAHFLDMEDDLSGEKTGKNGRHPLPQAQTFIDRLHAFGLSENQQVVLYDQDGGMMASRAWWMIRHWLGHSSVAVLSGGIRAWESANAPTTSNPSAITKTQNLAPLKPNAEKIISVDEVLHHSQNPEHSSIMVVDARSAERFHAAPESPDPIKGHIPNALNHFFSLNLNEDGTLQSPEQLKQHWSALLETIDNKTCVHQCGSGVSACHNWLALEHAQIAPAAMRLYVGSWSEWISDTSRPVASN